MWQWEFYINSETGKFENDLDYNLHVFCSWFEKHLILLCDIILFVLISENANWI